MSLIKRVKAAFNKDKVAPKKDHRLRVRAIRNIPNLTMVQGQTYRIDPGSAAHLKVLGWVELIDGIPGLGKAETQHKDMNEACRTLAQALAGNQKAVVAEFMGRPSNE